MNTRTVIDNDGNEFILTEKEEKVIRALERLEKMDFGRLRLFAHQSVGVRINDTWYGNEFTTFDIPCEGGDGGDRK